MNNEHRTILFFLSVVVISLVVMVIYTSIREQNLFMEKNEYCVQLGKNITSSEYLNDSFIESCECYYQNVVSKGMKAKCICDCYTDGSVCPNIKNGRCYLSVMIGDAGNII